jgi:hypothetical protein
VALSRQSIAFRRAMDSQIIASVLPG